MWPADDVACLFIQTENFWVNNGLLLEHYVLKDVLHPQKTCVQVYLLEKLKKRQR